MLAIQSQLHGNTGYHAMPELRGRRIGLLGGTFNPVHLGHMAMAEAALDEFSLSHVLFIPTGQPPHKRDIVPAEQRLEMLHLALEGQPGFALSTVEIDRQGFSYTIDTLRQLHNQYAGAQLFFIIGADTLLELMSWKDAAQVMRLTTFIVFPRAGTDDKKARQTAEQLAMNQGADILFSKHICPNIASNSIREAASKGEDILAYVPLPVAEFIQRRGLYRMENH